MFIIVCCIAYFGIGGLLVWGGECDKSSLLPGRNERQAILGRAIWWLPYVVYITIKNTIKLIIFIMKGAFNATYQMIREEFQK